MRYGNTWARFCENLKILDDSGIDYQFNATVSNLTLPGLKDFILWAKRPIMFAPCSDPDFLSISVLDNETKDSLASQITDLPKFVAESLKVEPSPTQVGNFKNYILEFAKRRALAIAVFPESMQRWIQS